MSLMKNLLERNPDRTGRASYTTRKLAPMIEVCESRQMLTGGVATGLGAIAGTTFVDLNRDGRLSTTDTYLAGVTVQLFKADCTTTPIRTTQTDAFGAYSFTGLQPGDYVLKEITPCGYKSTGAEVNSQLNPGAKVSVNTIKVTVVDPTKVFVNYNGVDPDRYASSDVKLYGEIRANAYGPMKLSLGTAPGATNLNAGYLSICVNDEQNLSFTGPASFQVKPTNLTELTGDADTAGRIAYLFNHYGNSSLNNVTGPALQLAIWELIYDGSGTQDADFTQGDFQISGPITTIGGADGTEVRIRAQQFFAESIGKRETAVFLKTATNASEGQQSMLATGQFNFGNVVGCDNGGSGHGGSGHGGSGHGGGNGGGSHHNGGSGHGGSGHGGGNGGGSHHNDGSHHGGGKGSHHNGGGGNGGGCDYGKKDDDRGGSDHDGGKGRQSPGKGGKYDGRGWVVARRGSKWGGCR